MTGFQNNQNLVLLLCSDRFLKGMRVKKKGNLFLPVAVLWRISSPFIQSG